MTNRSNPKLLKLSQIFITGAVLLCGCQHKDSERQSASLDKLRVSALGRIRPESEIRRISAPAAISGDRIEEIFIKENQYVKKGQPIARLSSFDSLKAAYVASGSQVTVAQHKLEQVKAGAKVGEIKAQEFKVESLTRELAAAHKAQDEIVARCKFQMEEAERQHQRFDGLLKVGAVSSSDADRYLVNAQTAEKNYAEAVETRAGKLRTLESQIQSEIQTREKIAEVRTVDVNVEQSELERAVAMRNKAKAELALATVLSPQDGQILSIVAHPGDKATAQGIAEMADTTQMIVVAEVYQTDAPKIVIGQKAKITSDGFSKSVEGTVYQLGSQVTKQKIFANQAGENLDMRVVEVKLKLNPKDIADGVNRASNLQVNVIFEPREASADR